MKHECAIEVRGYELDSFNHVNNAVYINYLEHARWMFFNDTKWIGYMRDSDLFPVVVETNIRYINELKVYNKIRIKSQWIYDGECLISKSNIYLDKTGTKVAKATVKMVLVSSERIVHEIPDFMKYALDNEETV